MSEHSLTKVASMPRANPMTPDERRLALIEATRPLLLEHGTSITTRQIAECADVAEGTIFRAFGTKQALIEAVVDDCLSPDALIQALYRIPVELDLEDTVTWVIKAMQARTRQVRSLMMALYPDRTGPMAHKKGPHQHVHRRINEALTHLLTRFDDQLRVGTTTASWAITAMSFASTLPFSDDPDTSEPRQVARLILHGITTNPILEGASC